MPALFGEIDPATSRYETSVGAATPSTCGWPLSLGRTPTTSDAALAMGRADERLRDLTPVPMAEYDHLCARGQGTVEAMSPPRCWTPIWTTTSPRRRTALTLQAVLARRGPPPMGDCLSDGSGPR